MEKLKLKNLLPENIRIQLHEEELDPDVKNVFDDMMKSLPLKMKSAISNVETELKGKSEEELEKIATDTDPLLGKLAQESIHYSKTPISERSTKKQSRINEDFGFMFYAGLALALPPIIEMIGKLAKTISQKLGGSGEFGEKFAHFGHELHAAYHNTLRRLLDNTLFKISSLKSIDENGKKQITDAIFMLIVAYMGFYSGDAAMSALKGLKLGPAAVESALAAIKGGEVVGWVTNTIQNVIS